MKPIITRSGEKLSEEKLNAFEQEHQVRFPAEYRAFLLHHNGGTPEPQTFCGKGEKEPSEVCQYFLGIGMKQKTGDLAWALEIYCDEEERRMPRRMLPIAMDAFGNMICLATAGKDAGKVYFWNHEEEDPEPSQKDPVENNLSVLADSLEQFLNQFAEDAEEKQAKRQVLSWFKMIKAGDLAAVAAWLDQGGNPNEQDKNFNRPVAVAVEAGETEIVELLLDRGASHEMALASACNETDVPLMKLILTHGKRKAVIVPTYVFQDVLSDSDDLSLIELFLDAGAPLNSKLQRGHALYHATEDSARPEVIQFLLKRGAKPGVWGYGGRLPLSNAICSGSLECAKLLMDAGENLYFQPPPEIPSWAKAVPDFKAPPSPRPADYLDQRGKKIKAIRSGVLAHAAALGQTPVQAGPLHVG